jgi:hypothetical protein
MNSQKKLPNKQTTNQANKPNIQSKTKARKQANKQAAHENNN